MDDSEANLVERQIWDDIKGDLRGEQAKFERRLFWRKIKESRLARTVGAIGLVVTLPLAGATAMHLKDEADKPQTTMQSKGPEMVDSYHYLAEEVTRAIAAGDPLTFFNGRFVYPNNITPSKPHIIIDPVLVKDAQGNLLPVWLTPKTAGGGVATVGRRWPS